MNALRKPIVIVALVAAAILQLAPNASASTVSVQGSASYPYVGSSGCSNGNVLVGIEGRQDWYIDAIRGVCAAPGTQYYSYNGVRHPLRGGSGGTTFAQFCGTGRAVVGLEVKVGWYIDSVRIMCRQLDSATRVSGPVFYGPVGHGGDGGTLTTAVCPDRPVTGLSIGYGSYVHRIRMTCADQLPAGS